MRARTQQIDWRHEFEHLDPYLEGSGGVVLVRYEGAKSAPVAFVDTLSSEFEARTSNGERTSIRIDREVYSTRYLSDLRAEFLRKLKVSVAPTAAGQAAQISVASGNSAGGSQHFETTINVHADEVAQAAGRAAWVVQVQLATADFLRSGRVMIVLADGPASDQDGFWRYLWRDALAPLMAKGLMLVQMMDATRNEVERHPLAPLPNLEIMLPAALDVARQEHAQNDLVAILLKELPGLPLASAQMSARTLVHACRRDVLSLHAGFAGLLPKLAQDWGDD